jgi:hypothetical protein
MTKYEFHGFTFYEDPRHGDEAPLLVKFGKRFFYTDLYDAPQDKQEAKEARSHALTGDAVYSIK